MNEKIDSNIKIFSGVTGHFEGDDPWTKMEYKIKPLMADLVGNSV